MEPETLIEIVLFIAGITVTICLAIFGAWLKLHHRQDSRIESLQTTNGKEHADLHKKIDHLDEKSEERGHSIREAVDKITHHLLHNKN